VSITLVTTFLFALRDDERVVVVFIDEVVVVVGVVEDEETGMLNGSIG
jgi:hypothetical protein